MPRRGGVPKRDVLPDPVYGSKVVTKLINQIMYDGKRGTAQNIVYDAFKTMSEKLGAYRRLQQRRRSRQEEGRHAQNGGSEQGVRAFQILSRGK